jgi:hypothetical protein
MKILFSLMGLLAGMACISAQQQQPSLASRIDPSLSNIQNRFLNKQAEALLAEAGDWCGGLSWPSG